MYILNFVYFEISMELYWIQAFDMLFSLNIRLCDSPILICIAVVHALHCLIQNIPLFSNCLSLFIFTFASFLGLVSFWLSILSSTLLLVLCVTCVTSDLEYGTQLCLWYLFKSCSICLMHCLGKMFYPTPILSLSRRLYLLDSFYFMYLSQYPHYLYFDGQKLIQPGEDLRIQYNCFFLFFRGNSMLFTLICNIYRRRRTYGFETKLS